MANPEHVKVVKQGYNAIAEWRKQYPEERLDLRWANLVWADLRYADLSASHLRGADLRYANLSGSHLGGTDLRNVNLAGSLLIRADLGNANLSESLLSEVDLSEVNLKGAIFGSTMFANCDLGQSRGIKHVIHDGPSTIGIDTVINSFRSAGNKMTLELETFFKRSGIPVELLKALPGIVAEVKYYSCFIFYGEPDKESARKLCHDLETKDVSCWIHYMDDTSGERTQREIKEAQRKADKMVVLCSVPALVRDGVLKEIEELIDEDPDKMVPVSLDNLWKQSDFLVKSGDTDLKPFLLDRNYADFSGAIPYDEALEKLLKGLEIKKVRRKKQRKQS